MSEPVRATHDLVVRFYDQLWNSWDDAAVDAVLAVQFRFRGSLGQHTVGRDGWRHYRDGIRAAAPDFHNEIVELIADGDRAAARLLYTGTHSGNLLGHPPTGRRFRYAGAAFFKASEGQLVDAWVLGDLADLTRQLVAP
ncbi:MAG: ester cyclase [Candidatus Nanopelagicales bacterium]|nr:ester cyclase [Candidatus Nanopelagicales bacterium]